MKAEKTLLIDDLLRRVNASPFLLVVDYTGLKVDKFAELRKRLTGVGAEIHVFKNNLVKKAAEKAGYPGELGAHLTGQSAYVTGVKDICATAKILKNFTAEFEKPVMKVGVLEGKPAGCRDHQGTGRPAFPRGAPLAAPRRASGSGLGPRPRAQGQG
jgi:large subunit ribosomal protein L10